MTTKQQEREALAQIRKIVDDLGENSYVGTAFAGCFEIADENIEYDFGDSMAQRVQSEHEKAVHNEGVATEACKALNAEKQKNAELAEQLEQLDDTLREVRTAAETLNHFLAKQTEATGEALRRAEAAELLVTQLKAKLYDYMTA